MDAHWLDTSGEDFSLYVVVEIIDEDMLNDSFVHSDEIAAAEYPRIDRQLASALPRQALVKQVSERTTNGGK